MIGDGTGIRTTGRFPPMAHANPQMTPATRRQGPKTPRTGPAVRQKCRARSRAARMAPTARPVRTVRLGSVRPSRRRPARTALSRFRAKPNATVLVKGRVLVRVRTQARARGRGRNRARASGRVRTRGRGRAPAPVAKTRILPRCSRLALNLLWRHRPRQGIQGNRGMTPVRIMPAPIHPMAAHRPAPPPPLTRIRTALPIRREPDRPQPARAQASRQAPPVHPVQAQPVQAQPAQAPPVHPARAPMGTGAISRTRVDILGPVPQASSPGRGTRVAPTLPAVLGRTEAKRHLGERSEDRAGARPSPSR